jgi:hypothetical protein
MKKLLPILLVLAACSKPAPEQTSSAPEPAAPSAPSGPVKSAAELEKEKAQANPYPNDLGPATLPAEYVASLSASQRKGYDLLVSKCSQCHTSARPLNSRFVEAKSEPRYSDKTIWQVEPSVWNRYVKRMMAKPGCKIESAEGKLIWEFLVADGQRKIGANAAAWKEHRMKLLSEFKAKNPKRYDELAAAKDL